MGSAAFARHYSRYRFLFLFLRLLRCFTSAGLAFVTLCVQVTSIALLTIRLPHSDTPGSSLACNSPRLFAACCVLLRLTTPRHPPQALLLLTLSRSHLSLSPRVPLPLEKLPFFLAVHFLFLEIVSFPFSCMPRFALTRSPRMPPSRMSICCSLRQKRIK